jgi:hypothetical protein
MMWALYLYSLGLGFKNTSRALEPFAERSHVAVWQWVQRFDLKQVSISAIQHHIAGELWRKVEIIDEGGKWFKVSCGGSLYLSKVPFQLSFFKSPHTRLFSWNIPIFIGSFIIYYNHMRITCLIKHVFL